jgi:two-component system heavy metal sensor histidine kinase CusS
MFRRSIRLRLTLGVLLVVAPFLFALSHLLMAMHALGHQGGPPGVVFQDREEGRHLLYTLSGVAIATFGVGAWLIVGRTLSPIADLAEQARNAQPGNPPETLVPSSDDREVVELVTTLNDLLQRVTDAAEAKGRFYAAASHELRTPLQALLGHLELAAARPRSAEEYRATIDEALAQAQRLASLVEGILLLHRIESERAVASDDVEVVPVLELCSEGMGAMVSGGPQVGFAVPAIPSHLEILLGNLLNNAVRHGRTGGEVLVGAAMCGEEGVITVANELPENAALDFSDLEGQFVRAHRARRNGDGNGLGIAICRAVCRANGWRLALEVTDGWFTAEVRFPSTKRADRTFPARE